MWMVDSLNLLIKKLNYQFESIALLELALTHRSASSSNNERLEYLGDAVLGFVIAESLYNKFSDAPEGILTRQRSSLVKKETLANLAKELELGQYIKLGSGEMKTGGWRRDSILSNTLEAIIGAIYLDSEFDSCRKFINQIYKGHFSSLSLDKSEKDSKTELQEYLQARKLDLPSYEVVAEEGEAHDRLFTVECKIQSLDEPICANGKSKRIAEQSAANKTLLILQSNQ
jgi:ribonuclease III